MTYYSIPLSRRHLAADLLLPGNVSQGMDTVSSCLYIPLTAEGRRSHERIQMVRDRCVTHTDG